MFVSGCVMQQRLRQGLPAGGMAAHQETPDVFAAGRAAGLAGGEDGMARRFQCFAQAACLGGLAHALASLKGDEATPADGATRQLAKPQITAFRAEIRRPNRPSCSTSAPATRGTSTGATSGALTTSVAMASPAAIGDGAGPS